jgi:DNA-binding NtrC family response regulator
VIKILLIDDDPEQIEILKTIVSKEGRDVTTCVKSKEALQLISKNKYDLVFTDISMPEVDGVQVMKYVKDHSPETTFVPITAFGDWGIYAQALRLGAKEFINKPFNIPEIQGVINKLFPA